MGYCMKLIMASCIGILFIIGCESTNKTELISNKSFITETKVTPSEKPHQYLVECSILEKKELVNGKGTSKQTQILNSPKIIVEAEEEGISKIFDKDEQNGIFISAFVSEKENKVTIKIILKEKGNDLLNQSQIINIPK